MGIIYIQDETPQANYVTLKVDDETLNDTMPVVLGGNPPSLVQYLPTSLLSPSADCVEAVFTFYLQVWTVHGGNELISSIFATMPPLRVWYIPTNLSCSSTNCLEAAFNRNFRPVRGGNESGCFNSAYLIYTYGMQYYSTRRRCFVRSYIVTRLYPEVPTTPIE